MTWLAASVCSSHSLQFCPLHSLESSQALNPNLLELSLCRDLCLVLLFWFSRSSCSTLSFHSSHEILVLLKQHLQLLLLGLLRHVGILGRNWLVNKQPFHSDFASSPIYLSRSYHIAFLSIPISTVNVLYPSISSLGLKTSVEHFTLYLLGFQSTARPFRQYLLLRVNNNLIPDW